MKGLYLSAPKELKRATSHKGLVTSMELIVVESVHENRYGLLKQCGTEVKYGVNIFMIILNSLDSSKLKVLLLEESSSVH